jgi:hypothetical protein
MFNTIKNFLVAIFINPTITFEYQKGLQFNLISNRSYWVNPTPNLYQIGARYWNGVTLHVILDQGRDDRFGLQKIGGSFNLKSLKDQLSTYPSQNLLAEQKKQLFFNGETSQLSRNTEARKNMEGIWISPGDGGSTSIRDYYPSTPGGQPRISQPSISKAFETFFLENSTLICNVIIYGSSILVFLSVLYKSYPKVIVKAGYLELVESLSEGNLFTLSKDEQYLIRKIAILAELKLEYFTPPSFIDPTSFFKDLAFKYNISEKEAIIHYYLVMTRFLKRTDTMVLRIVEISFTLCYLLLLYFLRVFMARTLPFNRSEITYNVIFATFTLVSPVLVKPMSNIFIMGITTGIESIFFLFNTVVQLSTFSHGKTPSNDGVSNFTSNEEKLPVEVKLEPVEEVEILEKPFESQVEVERTQPTKTETKVKGDKIKKTPEMYSFFTNWFNKKNFL